MVKILFFGIFVALSPAWGGSVVKGELFEKKGKSGKKLYDFTRKTSKEGDIEKVVRTFSYPDGKAAVIEEAFYKNGKCYKMTQDHRQLNTKGSYEIKDGKIFFSFTEDGKTSKSEEKIDGVVVPQDQIVPFLKANMAKLLAKETLSIRLPVFDRMETIGFKFKKYSSEKKGQVVKIRMSPSSFFISMLVSPIYFSLEKKKPHQELTIVGRTSPKIKKGGKWVNLDAIFKVQPKVTE